MSTDPRHSIKRHDDGTVDFRITHQSHAPVASGPAKSSKPIASCGACCICRCACWEGKLFESDYDNQH